MLGARTAAAPGAFLPHPRKGPQKWLLHSSWCFAPCLWAPVFGWLGVCHNCPQWYTPSPSRFPASPGQNQLPAVFSTASALKFPCRAIQIRNILSTSLGRREFPNFSFFVCVSDTRLTCNPAAAVEVLFQMPWASEGNRGDLQSY